MDTLPMPAWHLFDLKKYKEYPFRDKMINSNPHEFLLQTTRGCPYLCKFCSRNFGNKVRQKSPNIVVEEIAVLINLFNAQYLLFADETFTINKEYTKKLCTLIIERGLNKKISWSCATRVDKLDKEVLMLMKNAGFEFDLAFTSVLKRAILTLWFALQEMDRIWIPIQNSWRLNERHSHR